MMQKSLLLLLLLPTGANAILDFILSPLNMLVALFIDESMVCSSLPEAITGVGGIPLTCTCTAEIVPDGFFMFQLAAAATCSNGGLLPISATVSAESDTVGLLEVLPFIGDGIGAFDPFTLTTEFDVPVIGDVSIDSEATLFTEPPTAAITDASAGPLSCSPSGLQITCTVGGFPVCFDLAAFGTC